MQYNTTYRDYDNIGAQNGGWSLAWQGFYGNGLWDGINKESSKASSILDAFKSRFQEEQLVYNIYKDPTNDTEIAEVRLQTLRRLEGLDMNKNNTLIVGVLAEVPYSEWMGDINNPFCYGRTNWVQGCNYNFHANKYLRST